jgi:hypothetical protein
MALKITGWCCWKAGKKATLQKNLPKWKKAENMRVLPSVETAEWDEVEFPSSGRTLT